MASITHIQKRDGQVVDFDQQKITEAVWRAAESIGGENRDIAATISNQVVAVLEVFFKTTEKVPTVEQIQDLVEKILIESGHARTAKAFILYREQQNALRAKKQALLEGATTTLPFSQETFATLSETLALSESLTPLEVFQTLKDSIESTQAHRPEETAENSAITVSITFPRSILEDSDKNYHVAWELGFPPSPQALRRGRAQEIIPPMLEEMAPLRTQQSLFGFRTEPESTPSSSPKGE